MSPDLSDLTDEDFCYLTTTGRVTGKPHEIEMWFGLEDKTLYMLSGGGDRSDWVKNLRRDPEVEIRIADKFFEGRARVIEDAEEDELARRLLVEKKGAAGRGGPGVDSRTTGGNASAYTGHMGGRMKWDLPEKVCPACGRPFRWRKKWERDWESVMYCSDRCRSRAKRERRPAS